jgi:hypothetical protein
MAETLPDSRARHGVSFDQGHAGTWVPVFCANCGAEGGRCPAENMSFLFYLCNKCAETHGAIANTMMMPDEIFFQRLAEEQQERYGRPLTPPEWERVSEDASHPLYRAIHQLWP